MNQDLISVIMSVYNEEADWLKKSIESVLMQSYSQLEFIIVLDNPENNELKAIIESYCTQDPRIKFLINECNLGLVKSLNKALESVSGEYIARMDADDISYPERFQKEIDYLKNTKSDFVMASVDYIDEKEIIQTKTFDKKYDASSFAKIIKYGNVSAHPTWLAKKEVFNSLHGYREVTCCEDFDFILRALQWGYKIERMSEHLLAYRLRANGVSRSKLLEQFVKMAFLRDSYKQGRDIYDVSEIELKRVFDSISAQDRDSFSLAINEFWDGKQLLGQKKFFSALKRILSARKKSRYFRKYFNDNLKWSCMTHII